MEINIEAMQLSVVAENAYNTKNYTEALNNFDKAILLMPSNHMFYSMRGNVYEDMGDTESAENDYRKSLEIESDNYLAAYRLGMLYFSKKDFENAIKWLKISNNKSDGTDGLEKSLGITKQNLMFVSKKVKVGNLGNFLTQVGQFKEGIKYLDEAIKLDPNYINPYMTKGMAYAQMGQPRKGILFLQKALQLGHHPAEMAINFLENLAKEQ
jgi:tetratricopeptide (TPR) repeat protein